MIETTEILLNYALYHEWVSNETLIVVQKSKLITEEISPYLNRELDIHNYWLSVTQEIKHIKRIPSKSLQEIIAAYTQYHESWKNFISLLQKQDFTRMVKITNEAGLIKTHTLIDLILESFRLIEAEQRLIAQQLENNYRKKLKLGFLDYRQRINSL